MLIIPINIAQHYETLLVQQEIPINQRSYYYKWLRYYLDFCDKYQFEPTEKRNFSAFNDKLRSKNQSEAQRRQAKQAIAIYYRGIVGQSIVDHKVKPEPTKETHFPKGNVYWSQTASQNYAL